MFTEKQMEMLLKKAMSQIGLEDRNCYDDKKKSKNKKDCKLDLSSSQILIIIALLANVLEVDSFLVDRNQQIQIVLTGSLKQKTQLDKIMDQLGELPFDEVMQSILGRY